MEMEEYLYFFNNYYYILMAATQPPLHDECNLNCAKVIALWQWLQRSHCCMVGTTVAALRLLPCDNGRSTATVAWLAQWWLRQGHCFTAMATAWSPLHS